MGDGRPESCGHAAASMSTICLECWWALEDRARSAESKLESSQQENAKLRSAAEKINASKDSLVRAVYSEWENEVKVLKLQIRLMQPVVDAASEYAEVFRMEDCNNHETGDTIRGLQVKMRMAEALDALKKGTEKRVCERCGNEHLNACLPGGI